MVLYDGWTNVEQLKIIHHVNRNKQETTCCNNRDYLPSLSFILKISRMYLEPSRISMMELFCK